MQISERKFYYGSLAIPALVPISLFGIGYLCDALGIHLHLAKPLGYILGLMAMSIFAMPFYGIFVVILCFAIAGQSLYRIKIALLLSPIAFSLLLSNPYFGLFIPLIYAILPDRVTLKTKWTRIPIIIFTIIIIAIMLFPLLKHDWWKVILLYLPSSSSLIFYIIGTKTQNIRVSFLYYLSFCILAMLAFFLQSDLLACLLLGYTYVFPIFIGGLILKKLNYIYAS